MGDRVSELPEERGRLSSPPEESERPSRGPLELSSSPRSRPPRRSLRIGKGTAMIRGRRAKSAEIVVERMMAGLVLREVS